MNFAMLDSILNIKTGNTLIVGAVGTSKTVLLNSLYHTSRIVLDGLPSLHLSSASIHGILASGLAVITVNAMAQLGYEDTSLLNRISNFVFFRITNPDEAEIAASLSNLKPELFMSLPESSAIVCDRSGHIEAIKVEP
jgi:hypothetical protein